MLKLIFFFFLTVLISSRLPGQPYQSTVDIRIPSGAQKVTISGKAIIYYELYITSFSNDTIQLKKLRVLNASDSSLLNSVEAEAWMSQSTRIENAKMKSNLLPPGATVIVYMEVNVMKSILNLVHRLDIEIKNKPLSIL